MSSIDRNDIAFWLPKIASVVRTPKTLTIPATLGAETALEKIVYAVAPSQDERHALELLVEDIKRAAYRLGWVSGRPVFLRSGHTSGKHEWENGPFLPPDADVLKHMLAITEYAKLAGIFGLPVSTWAVREMLDVEVLARCQLYRGMPITQEWRVFVRIVDGRARMTCWHQYWPEDALVHGGIDRDEARRIVESFDPLPQEAVDMAETACACVGFNVSVDIMRTRDGALYVTDMAEYERSWHPEGCPHA